MGVRARRLWRTGLLFLVPLAVALVAGLLADYFRSHVATAAATLGFGIVVGLAYLIARRFERKRVRVRVRLVIDAKACRPWIAEGGYDDDVAKAIIRSFDKWNERWSAAEGDKKLQRRISRHQRRLRPELTWSFLFLGDPTSEETLVWSGTWKTLHTSRYLVYDTLWRRYLAGTTLQKLEPHFIVERRRLTWPPILEIYLSPRPALGRKRSVTTLCTFPLELLQPGQPVGLKELLAKHGLEFDPGHTDVTTDEHGKPELYVSHGVGNVVYKHKWFTFTVNVEQLEDGQSV